jgi:hypothetical protein
MGFLRQPKTLDEIEEEAETASAELQLAEKKRLLKETERQYGKGGWKMFSFNGKMSGIDWDKIRMKL